MLCASFIPLLWGPLLFAATLQDFGYSNMLINGQPALGTRPLLVILANFAGKTPLAHDSAYYDDLVFNPSRFPGLNGYFLAASNGRFSWSRGAVIGPLNFGANETDANYPDNAQFVSNIVYKAMASGLFNFAAYDANHDGHVAQAELGILVIGYFTGMRPSPNEIRAPGSSVEWHGSVALVEDAATFGVHCEEFEETLGCQDLYGYDNGLECLSQRLTFQSCNFRADDVYYLDPWERMRLGWCEPRLQPMASGGVLAIPAAQLGDPTAPVLLYDPVAGLDEFFIIEYRTTNSPYGPGYDANTAGQGLAVWHCKQTSTHSFAQWPDLIGPVNDYVDWNDGPPNLDRTGSHSLWGSDATTPHLKWLGGVTTPTRLHVFPFTSGAGSITVEWLTDGDTWVDFSYTGPMNGTFSSPYNTLTQASNAGSRGGTINIKAGSTSETVVLTNKQTILSYGGPATIGR
jgi:M6 family metalloprotease-like protein